MDFFTDFSRTMYYPSCVVNMQIRFDEGLTTLPKPESVDDLAKIGGQLVDPAIEQPLLAAKGSDNLSQVIGIIPLTCTVELASYRLAGKFDMTFPYRDLPLDPRVIRALAVSIHLDTVPENDFARGMTNDADIRSQSGKQRPSVVLPTNDNLVLYGTVDVIGSSFNDSGMVVHIEGRDLRGIFIDAPVNAKTLAAIDFKQPIDKIVKRIVDDLVPMGAGIKVVASPAEDWPDGAVPSPGDAFTRNNLDAQGTKPQTGVKGDVSQQKMWDLVTQYCFLVGAIPHFVGQELRIVPTVSIYETKKKERTFNFNTKTPFKGDIPRLVKSPLVKKPEQFQYRRLVYGRDILSLTFERKLGGLKVPIVQLISVDTSSKEKGIDETTGLPKNVIFVEEPEDSTDPKTGKARTTSVSPSGQITQAEPMRLSMPGIKDKKRLRQIAKALREEIGRQEIGGSVSTRNLASFGGDRQDPDLLRLRPGDPLEIRVDASGLAEFPPPVAELVAHESRTRAEEEQAIKERLGNSTGAANLARVLVATMRSEVTQLQKTFRIGNVKFTWSADSGVAIDADFQNYVETRFATG